MSTKVAILACLALFCCIKSGQSFALHASCKLTWTWNVNCSVPKNAIANQMVAWSGSNCDGEKCLYKITVNQTDKIAGTHTTPVKHYVDDLTMSFSESQEASGTVCTVNGYSTSEVWYAVLDDGTNYCNLHNLVVGAGIDKVYGFTETTSNDICTQYSSADCSKY